MSNVMETVSGKFIDVLNPNPDDLDIDDIVWHLSRINRFSGATITAIPYSVAQHSVFVMELVKEFTTEKEILKAAILHDAAEYIISDIPSPVKHLPGVREIIDEVEMRLLKAITNKFGVDYEKHQYIIHAADMKARAIEAYQFMNSRGRDWVGLPKISLIDIQQFEEPWNSLEAYQIFKQQWELLNNE